MARSGRRPKDATPILWQAPEVRDLARRIIEAHHHHLEGKLITYAFAPKTLKVRGKPASGKCEIVGGKTAAFARGLPASMAPVEGEDRFFLITIAFPVWVNLTDAQKEALVDHELCFPEGTVVSGPNTEASIRRRYSGEIVGIATASGHFVTGTPNHPVLTERGWVPLRLLQEGEHVFCCADPQRVAAAVDPHEYQVPARIEQVSGPRRVLLGLVPEAAQHLNANVADRQVYVEAPDGHLVANLQAALSQHLRQILLSGRDRIGVGFAGLRHLLNALLPMGATAPCFVGSSSVGRALFRSEPPHAVSLGGARTANGHVGLNEQSPYDGVVGAEMLRQRLRGGPGEVTPSKIVRINVRSFTGHVYNLQTSQGWYIANSIVTHNCHAGVNDKGSLTVWPHDVEEFRAIIDRHGLWEHGVRKFAESCASAGQLDLPLKGEQSGARPNLRVVNGPGGQAAGAE